MRFHHPMRPVLFPPSGTEDVTTGLVETCSTACFVIGSFSDTSVI
ncbi:hypothetical protein [Bartonella schoenbuchensis]